MMRVASLLLALSLFTSAATACAEYAWVLWGPQRADEAAEEARVWWMLGAHFTQSDCEARRDAVCRVRLSDDVSFKCLPDTVGPHFKRLLISGRLAPGIPDEDGICSEEGQRSQKSR